MLTGASTLPKNDDGFVVVLIGTGRRCGLETKYLCKTQP
jgi:hypothetical protein